MQAETLIQHIQLTDKSWVYDLHVIVDHKLLAVFNCTSLEHAERLKFEIDACVGVLPR